MAFVQKQSPLLNEVADSAPMLMKNIARNNSAATAATRSPTCSDGDGSCDSDAYNSRYESYSDSGEGDAPYTSRSTTAPPIVASIESMLSTEYPADLIVRNTFLDFAPPQPGSLRLRMVQSAPCSPAARATSEDECDGQIFFAMATSRILTLHSTLAAHYAPELANDSAKPQFSSSAVPTILADASWMLETMPASPLRIVLAREHALELASDQAKPEFGSLAMPTVGSTGHHKGICKPCAFFWKQGCGNGVECSFCHLCDSDEKRRRQKEKKANIKERVGAQQMRAMGMKRACR